MRRRARVARRCGRARSCPCRRSPCPRPARGSPARRAPPAGRRRCRGSRPCGRSARPARPTRPSRRCAAAASRGTPNSASSSSSQSSVTRSTSSVRDAFVTSITCCSPPVSRQTRKLSTVPNASPSLEPCSRSSHSSFVAEKYGSGTRPVLRADELGIELAAAFGGAPVLPDDRRRDGLAGRAVPEQRRLALVRDRHHVGLAPRPPRAAPGDARPDLLRVVLDPARLRKVLRQLAVAATRDAAARRRAPGTSCRSCPGRSRGSRVRGDELERAAPGVVGVGLELLLLAVEEAVRCAVVADDLVLDARAGQRLVERGVVLGGDVRVGARLQREDRALDLRRRARPGSRLPARASGRRRSRPRRRDRARTLPPPTRRGRRSRSRR